MDEKTTHYKKVLDKFTLIEYKNNNIINALCNIKGDLKYGYWEEISQSNVNEEKFTENYANVGVGLDTEKIIIVVEEYGDKISCKLYSTFRNRRVGSRFFRVRKSLTFITYNIKSKNFYTGSVRKKNKMILGKRIRVNDFYNHPFSSLNLEIRRNLRDASLMDGINNNDSSKLDYGEFSNDIMNVFLNTIIDKEGVKLSLNGKELEHKFHQLYLEVNGFKYPNNHREYSNLSITKKLLKKHINVVSLFMSINNLRGKKVRKILNEGHNIDFITLVQLYSLLGVNYFNNLNDGVFTKSDMYFSSEFKIPTDNVNFNISNPDRRRIVTIMNMGVKLHLIIDHLRMVTELENKYKHLFKIKFKTPEEFTDEHYDLSELLQSYKKGQVTRFYGKDFKNNVSESITDLVGVEYYPNVLFTSEEYNEESQTQKNCVRTYIEFPNNIIISLRVGDKESKIRATLEYRFIGDTVKRVQSMGSKNSQLSTMWEIPLEILDGKVSSLYRSKILQTPELTKVYRSGYTLKRKSLYDGVILIWDNDNEMDEVTNIDLPF